jgi:hypothetical protein
MAFEEAGRCPDAGGRRDARPETQRRPSQSERLVLRQKALVKSAPCCHCGAGSWPASRY